MTTKAHHVLLTDAEWKQLYDVYPCGIPVCDPRLQQFAQMSKDPQHLIEGTQIYREVSWQCRCWMCEHILAQSVITGYHLYVVLLNKICAGGEPRYQVN